MAAGVMAGTGITTMAAETISDAQAKAIALEDAGLSADQVTFDRIEMGTEQGASVYEIEFKTGSMEYDYDVQAETRSAKRKQRASQLMMRAYLRQMLLSSRQNMATRTASPYMR